MKLTTREMQLADIDKIVDYFLDADADYLKGMGADKSKFLNRKDWQEKLTEEYHKSYPEKEYYYIIWFLDGEAVGHSNINTITFGESAVMHLHLWPSEKRKAGLGTTFMKQTIDYYFKHLQLKKIICEPKAENVAPNTVLRKVGFEFIKSYETTPGWINFHQTVSRYELTLKAYNVLTKVD